MLVCGKADALVCTTGASLYTGKTTALVESAGTVSHFQRAVLRIANYLIVIAVALVTLVVVVSLIRGNPVLRTLEFALVVSDRLDPGGAASGAVGDHGHRRTPAGAPRGGGQWMPLIGSSKNTA